MAIEEKVLSKCRITGKLADLNGPNYLQAAVRNAMQLFSVCTKRQTRLSVWMDFTKSYAVAAETRFLF